MAWDRTKYDYDALVQELTSIVASKGTWADTYQSSTGQTLIQLVAIAVDNLHYMLERRSQENFLPTARLATSVGALANLLGYRPDRRISARGTLSLQLVDGSGIPTDNSGGGTITIPKYTRITQDIYNFVTAETYTFLPTQTYPVDIEVFEGSRVVQTFDSSDPSGTLFNKGYVLIEDYQNIENGSFYIYTPTQVFEDVEVQVGNSPPIGALAFANADDKVYDVRITNRGIQIVFGDGINGEKPVGIVTVEYVTSSGADVEIIDTGLVFAFESNTLVDDDVPANSYFYTLSNTTSINGGEEAETVIETQRRAPDFVRTGARAVTNADYEYWAKKSNIGGITDAKSYGEQEKGITVSEANNVYLTYLTDDGLAFTETEMTDFRAYMDIYKTATTHLIVQEATIIPLQLNVFIKRSTELTASNSEVYDYLKQTIDDFLALGEGSLGNSVYHSEIVETLHNLTMQKAGIDRSVADYVHVDVRALFDLNIPYSTKLDTTATISLGTNGDAYRLTIDGELFEYVQQGGDTADDIARILASYIDYGANVISSATTNIITVSLDPNRRTNEFLYSESIANAYWTKTGCTPNDASGLVIAPNGQYHATELVEDTSNGLHAISVSALAAGQKITRVRAKANTRDHIEMYYYNSLNGERATTVFDLTNGLVVSGSGAITAGENGWYLCDINDSASSVVDEVHISIYNAGRNYLGDGTSSVFLYGLQLQYATTFTQYIKTTGTALDEAPAQQDFTISKAGTTVPGNILLTGDFYLPSYLLDNPDLIDLFVRGSVELIDDLGNILYVDDGAGSFAGGTIDYTTGQVVIPLPEAEQQYWIRYLQNTDENFSANPEQAFIYSLPKNSYTDTVERLSTIVLEL